MISASLKNIISITIADMTEQIITIGWFTIESDKESDKFIALAPFPNVKRHSTNSPIIPPNNAPKNNPEHITVMYATILITVCLILL